MKKMYRLYSENYEGEYTDGYVELSKGEYNVLNAIAEELEGDSFELEEVKSTLQFEDLLKKEQNDLERQRKYREEQEKDKQFVSMREEVAKKFVKAMENLDKKYEGKKDSLKYMMERTAIISSFNQDMAMAEFGYASRKMMNNLTGSKRDGNDGNRERS